MLADKMRRKPRISLTDQSFRRAEKAQRLDGWTRDVAFDVIQSQLVRPSYLEPGKERLPDTLEGPGEFRGSLAFETDEKNQSIGEKLGMLDS